MDTGYLFLSLAISSVGAGYFIYGRKRPSMPFLVSGLVMMGFSYFMDSFWLSVVIGIVLAAAPFFIH